MKNTFLALAAFGLLLTFSACKKDNDKNSTFFRFKVDGASFEATGLLAYAVDFSSENTFYGIKDQSGNESCYINVPATATPGTYTLDGGDYNAYYIDANDKSYSTHWGDGIGTLTIEEIDGSHAKGTFQFDCYDSATETLKKTITEGEFNVAFR